MIKTGKIISMATFGMLLAGLSSCVSTEIIEPEKGSQTNSDDLTLSFSAPADRLDTRADDSHKLRYIAFVIPRSNGSYDWTKAQRKEIIENERKSDNVIAFKVDPDQDYMIGVFADYIPVSSQADGNGYYADYYYNTQTKDSYITLNPNPESSSGISTSFFNNDYYDCFSFTKNVHKEKTRLDVECELDRATAKVRFIDENASKENFSDITFSALSYVTQFVIQTQECGVYSNVKSADLQNVKLTEMANPAEHELFYFYTLAGSKGGSIVNLKGITFTSTNTQEKSNKTQIPEYTIPIQKNFITTVKGSFVPVLTTPDPGVTTPEEGDLYLNVSVNDNWQTGQTVNQ